MTAPVSSTSVPPGPIGAALGLDQPRTLAKAQALVAYQILRPSLLEVGEPGEVYVATAPPRGRYH